jgi:hypothetical protein
MHLESQNFGGLSRVGSNAKLSVPLDKTNGKSSSDPSNENREQRAQDDTIISSVFNLHLGDTTLDNAALASKLLLLFDDDDVEEDVSSLSLPSPLADSCFGIVDSITLTRCKRLEFLVDDGEDGDMYEYGQSEDEEDKDLNRVTQKSTSLCTHSHTGIRRGNQNGNIVAIKTKTTDG